VPTDPWYIFNCPRVVHFACPPRADWALEHRDLVRRFVDAYYGAVRYVNAHLAETAPYTAELTKVDLATAQKLHRSTGPMTLDVALIQPLIDAAAKYGVLEQSFPARDLL
jgi:ABC-type nitrate/sulfonate/bicarbonate transport system substrate-binding protein